MGANTNDFTEPPEKYASFRVIRWVNKLSRFTRSPFVASMLLIYLPVMATGITLSLIYGIPVFSRGISLALFWLALAPWLIREALYLVVWVFRKHKDKFNNEQEWHTLFLAEVRRLQSPSYQLFGYPWATATTAIIWYSLFRNMPVPIQAWAVVSFFILFHLSAIGFRGILVMVTMIAHICSSDTRFTGHHPDRFGGYASFGRFAVRESLLFSSGALVIPLAVEILTQYKNGQNMITVFTYLLLGIFLLVMITGFIWPVLDIKRFIDRAKEKAILGSWERIHKMMDTFSKSEHANSKVAVEIYFQYIQTALMNIKNYPFDTRVLTEFGLSFLLPIGIAVFEIFIKKG